VRAIGINTWVWTSPLTDAALPDLLQTIAAAGFDGVELPLEKAGDLDPHATAALLKEHGLSAWVVGAMAPGRDLVATSPETVATTQDYLRACIDLATAVGAPSVCGPFYAQTGRVWRLAPGEREAVYAEWRGHLAPVAAYAGERGVRIGIEPLNRYETSLVNTVDQALTGLGPLLGETVGLALDTYHLNIEERSSADAIRAAGEYLVHLQVCGSDRGAPGGDQTDWPAIVGALDEVGYQGALTIESFTPDNASIAVAASIWRPLAASPDDLAHDGLAFLRSLLAEGDPHV
jgi:D-psicose/D-tagatose/L-ribulose 3-epimerase